MSEERFASCLEKTFSLGSKTKEYILRHPEMHGELEKIDEVLKNPDEVRISVGDTMVLLFYKLYPKTKVTSKFLSVAVKSLNDEGFIITAFFTDKMKKGETIWKRS